MILPSDYGALVVPAAAEATKLAGYPTTLQFSAFVRLADNSTNSVATWLSDRPQIASVSQTGLVKAIAVGAGPGPWEVYITATSPDKKVKKTRKIIVKALGDIELTVE